MRPNRRTGAGRPRRPAGAPAAARARVTGRAVVLVLVLTVLAVSYASSMRAYLEQRSHLAALRESIASSEQNIAELRREKRRWRDPAYVEVQATQRFGWVMPGEIGFQVVGRDGEPLGHSDNLSDPGAVEVVNDPAWWETAWQTMEAAGHPERVPDPADEIDPPPRKRKP